MGYFAKLEDAADYEQQWCCNCVNGPLRNDGRTCPLWELQGERNDILADVTGDPLNELIPPKKDGNGKCRMFRRMRVRRADKVESDPRQIDMF